MRMREEVGKRPGHYEVSTTSTPKRVFNKTVECDPANWIARYSKVKRRWYIQDEVHTKVTRFPYNRQTWDVGDAYIFKANDVDASAFAWCPWSSYYYIGAGWAEVVLDNWRLLSAAQPEVSDFELYQRALPCKESMSLPNMLFELKDLKKSMQTLGELFDWGVQSASISKIAFGLLVKAFNISKEIWESPKTCEKFLRQAGGQHLNTQFGVLPTVSDLYKLAMGFIQFDDEISRLKREAGQLITRRTSCKLNVEWDDSWLSYTHGGLSLNPLISNSEFDVRVEGSRTFVGKFSYELPGDHNFGVGITNLDTELKRRLLGLRNLSLGDLWQAIPWTWLIDWVTNTSSMLGKDTIVPVKCHEWCTVDAIDVTFKKCDMHWMCPTKSELQTVTKIGDQNAANPHFTLYRRKQHTSDDLDMLEGVHLQGLNVKQLSLLAAIGHSFR